MNDLSETRKRIEGLQKELGEAKGALNFFKELLRDDYNCKSLSDANTKLEAMKKERDEADKEVKQLYEEVTSKIEEMEKAKNE